MEKEKNIEAKAENQIREASSLPFIRSGNWEHTERSNFNNNITGNWPVKCGDFNIFLIQNKGKGPPGKARSPGNPVEFIPDRVSNPVRDDIEPFIVLHGHPLKTKHIFRHRFQSFGYLSLSKKSKERPLSLSKGNTECNFLQSINSNFLQTLNFKIMKKQILILAIFVLAFFASTTVSLAQDLNYIPATTCAPVTLLPCASDDALHPIPGKTYTYSVAVNPGVTTGDVKWFVYNATASGTLITGGSITAAVTAAEARGGASQFLLDADIAKYNVANTSGTIDASWQSFDGITNRILLVAYVQGNGSCSDNIEVFRIEPNIAFTLDIAGLMPSGLLPVSGNAVECLTPVQSAVYDGTNLTMDYGDNYVYFTVTAANFVHSWTPTFSIVGKTVTSPLALGDITWAYPAQAVLNAAGAATGTWNSATTPILAQAATKAVGAAGECIVVRVHVDHGNNENDAATTPRTVTIGVDGVMYNVPTTDYSNLGLKDLDPIALAPCTNTVTDQAVYDLTSRPEVTTTVVVGGFEPKN
jgi:hypothetical protein